MGCRVGCQGLVVGFRSMFFLEGMIVSRERLVLRILVSTVTLLLLFTRTYGSRIQGSDSV